jgi:hypothetical protein
MRRAVWEEVPAQDLGRDVALADVGSLVGATAGRVAAGRHDPEEVVVRQRPERVRMPVLVDHHPVDLLEHARRVGVERLATLVGRAAGASAVAIPRRTVDLAGHVRQRDEAVLGAEDDLVDGHVVRPGPLGMECAVRVEVAVRRGVEVRRITLERMRAELLDINRNWRRDPLRPQDVIAHRRAVGIPAQRQAILLPRFITGNERFAVLNGSCGSRKDGDARLILVYCIGQDNLRRRDGRCRLDIA